jgi:carbamate kinase
MTAPVGTAPLAVVAIGGNALVTDEGHRSLADQASAVARACTSLADLSARGWRIVVTHGNGPQVGFILRRSEIAHRLVPVVPMDYATADTQGAIGSMFQRALYHEFFLRRLDRSVVTLVTHVAVDPDDLAFSRPDKPIGVFYDEARALQLARRLGWQVAEDSGRGWRRVVPSPRPQAILEAEDIAHLSLRGRVVVACGGGGIPVVRGSDGTLSGVEAVIDKDRTSALLARLLGAQAFLLCTGVDAVFTGWGTPAQKRLERLDAAEARALLAAGEFGAGSMRPKVEAALDYLGGPADGPRRAIIGRLERLPDLVEGTSGTTIGEAEGRQRTLLR